MRDKKMGLPLWAWFIVAGATIMAPPLLVPVLLYMGARSIKQAGQLFGMSTERARWLLITLAAALVLIGVTLAYGPLWWAEGGIVAALALSALNVGWRYVLGIHSLLTQPQGPFQIVDPTEPGDPWVVRRLGLDQPYTECGTPGEAYRAMNGANVAWQAGRREERERVNADARDGVR